MQVWNCCAQVTGNTGSKRLPKNRHRGTIAQLCRAISSQVRHVSTVEKKLVKQQCLPYMSSQYDELRPSSGWDLLALIQLIPSDYYSVREKILTVVPCTPKFSKFPRMASSSWLVVALMMWASSADGRSGSILCQLASASAGYVWV